MVVITIYFHLFVCNISIIPNILLSVCEFSFTGYFPKFYLINDSMFTILLIHIFLELFIQTDIIFLCIRIHYTLWIKCFWSWKLKIRHQLIYIVLVNGIDTIDHLFAMTRCTYTSINYNWVKLGQNLHKVYCWGTYILLCTTISIFPYFTSCWRHYFLFF